MGRLPRRRNKFYSYDISELEVWGLLFSEVSGFGNISLSEITEYLPICPAFNDPSVGKKRN